MTRFPGLTIRQLITVGLYLTILIILDFSPGCSPSHDASFQQGQEIFKDDCVACHGVNGGGVLYSRSVLNNDPFVLGDPKKVVAVILFGREGYGTMPGWNMNLKDQEVAAVATYIRQAWSNQAGPVTPAMVAEIRAKGEKPASAGPLK
jgi:mono/diheme cytochrome c family protein